MYVSTTTSPFAKYGDDKAILRLLKESGFTAYDYSMCESYGLEMTKAEDYREQAQALRSFADEIGLPCNQTHAPFPTAIKGNEEYNRKIIPQIIRSIEISGILGAKHCVVHPCNDYTVEENIVLYKNLEEAARKAGVKIAVENMWNWWHWGKPDGHVLPAACSHQDDFFAHMEALAKDVYVSCVDIGHAEMMHAYGTNAVKLIKTLGSYMQCMHLHDVNLVDDNHSFPFTQSIDYAPIIATLKEIGYKGDITMEARLPSKYLPIELIPAATRYLAEIGKYFKNAIEN